MNVLCVGSLLILCSFTDLKKRAIPIWILILYTILVFVQIIAENKVANYTTYLGILPGLILLGISKVTRESIGYGDGILLMITGLFLGLSQNIVLLLFAFFLLSLFAIAYLLVKKGGKNVTLPFVPFLAGAYVLLLLTTN